MTEGVAGLLASPGRVSTYNWPALPLWQSRLVGPQFQVGVQAAVIPPATLGAKGSSPATVPPGRSIDCQRARAVPRGGDGARSRRRQATAESGDPKGRPRPFAGLLSTSSRSLWTDKRDMNSIHQMEDVVKTLRRRAQERSALQRLASRWIPYRMIDVPSGE